MEKIYLKEREKNIFGRFKFHRRCEEAVSLIETFKPVAYPDILDIGACDGKMLKFVKDRIATGKTIGIEENECFVSSKISADIDLIKSSAESLPFKNNSFDVILASSVIEHIQKAGDFFKETFRVLKKNGILIIFAAVPFYADLAVKLKLQKNDHYKNFKFKELKEKLEFCGFRIIYSDKFSLPSVASLLKLEMVFEKILKLSGLNFLMFYREIIAKK